MIVGTAVFVITSDGLTASTVAASVTVGHSSPYLPGVSFPSGLRASIDVAEVLDAADVVLVAVPSHALRTVATAMSDRVPATAAVVSLVQGIERDTLLRPTEILAECLPHVPSGRIGALSGPNLVADGVRSTVAARDLASRCGGVNPTEAAQQLMGRAPRPEVSGLS